MVTPRKIDGLGQKHLGASTIPSIKAYVRYWHFSDLTGRTNEVRLWGDIVAKVFLGWRTKILRAADALYARQREGPYRFIQN
jgi:hypothetical protein